MSNKKRDFTMIESGDEEERMRRNLRPTTLARLIAYREGRPMPPYPEAEMRRYGVQEPWAHQMREAI